MILKTKAVSQELFYCNPDCQIEILLRKIKLCGKQAKAHTQNYILTLLTKWSYVMQGRQKSSKRHEMAQSYAFDRETIEELMKQPNSNLKWVPTMDFELYNRDFVLNEVVNKGNKHRS